MNDSIKAPAAACLLALAASARGEAPAVFAGTGVAGNSGDGGPALKAQLISPFGLVRGPDGALWFADYDAGAIRRIAADGTISTEEKGLNHPHELRFDRMGNLFIADTDHFVIRRFDLQSKQLTTFAGTGQRGYSGDGGAATNAAFAEPISLQFGPAGDLFVADISNHAIRRIDAKTGAISTWAGTGKPGTAADGAPIHGSPLNGPRSLDFDAEGNLWLVEREGNRVLEFDVAAGAVRLAAGTGKKGFSGDGGPAAQATFSGPKGIAVGSNGDVYLADTENNAIRRLDHRTKTIQLVAGVPGASAESFSSSVAVKLNRPHGIFVDADGTLFVSDSDNHVIRKLSPGKALPE